MNTVKKIATISIMVVLCCVFAPTSPAQTPYKNGGLSLEVGDAVTLGRFNYKDADITIKTEWFHPRGGLEYCFKGTSFSLGAELSFSKNAFDGSYKDEGDGTVDIERKEFAAFGRLGDKNGSNLRLGYRYFKYNMANGHIYQYYDSGFLEEEDKNGIATANMSKGIDVEGTLAYGDKLKFALSLGYTFFIDAEYDWEYDEILYPGGNLTHKKGTATLDAHSVRIRPEFSYAVTDNLRVFINYMLAASAWTGTPEGEKDYAGVDIYSGACLGLRYFFALN
jgi:hypothetical protein